MEIAEGFVEKGCNNNGKPCKSSKISSDKQKQQWQTQEIVEVFKVSLFSKCCNCFALFLFFSPFLIHFSMFSFSHFSLFLFLFSVVRTDAKMTIFLVKLWFLASVGQETSRMAHLKVTQIHCFSVN